MNTSYIQFISFTALVIQNAGVAIVTHVSRQSHDQESKDGLYLASSAVLVTELVKFLVSFIIEVCRTFRLDKSGTHKKDDDSFSNNKNYSISLIVKCIFDTLYASFDIKSILLLSLPSCLYAVQNNALYVALEHLDVGLFQVLSSLKLLTTALFSVILLGRRLSILKWTSLLLLTIGVSLAQLSPESVDTLTPTHVSSVGLISMMLCSFTSGLAGCWFELISKRKPDNKQQKQQKSLWMNNIHLTIPSILFSLVKIYGDPVDRTLIEQNGLLHGYNTTTYLVIAFQALGGILISILVHYADSIIKGYATSIAIILNTLISSYMAQEYPPWTFLVGAGLVSLSTVLFGYGS